MDTVKLIEWLTTEKKMGTRSAKDVLSRYGRVCKILGTDKLDETSLEKLQNCEKFKEYSIFIKSQLKRTITLCLEFMSNYKHE